MSKFKVGDRIRSLEDGIDITRGHIYVVTDCHENIVTFYDDEPHLRSRLCDDYELVEPAEAPKTTKRYYVVNEIDTGRPLTLEEAKERAKEYVGSDGDEWFVVESILKFVPETIVKEVPIHGN